jgi:hypothetical protein
MEIGLPVFSTFSETHSCTSRMDGKSPNITLNISRREEAWASSAHSGDTRGFSAASERHELGPSTVQWNISDGIFDGIYDYVRYMLSVLSMHYRSISVVAAHLPKAQPFSVGLFHARNATAGAVPRLGLLSATLPPPSFSAPFPPHFSLCSLFGS